MKTYTLINFDTGNQGITFTKPDGTSGTIPLDPANTDYAEYLRYTEWVEAGNNPEDFWRQDGDQ